LLASLSSAQNHHHVYTVSDYYHRAAKSPEQSREESKVPAELAEMLPANFGKLFRTTERREVMASARSPALFATSWNKCNTDPCLAPDPAAR
jgi:hypothetical protein